MKKMMLLVMILITSMTLIACGGDEAGDKITIDFWHMSPVGSTSFSGMRSIINDFNESQDTYFVRGTGFSFWDYWDKINVAVASRTAPDIGLSTIDDVEARARSGVLYNISDLMASDTTDAPLEVDEFRQSQLDFATYQGDLYAMPFSATTRVLYYNLDMFAEEGLTEADVPETWDELKTIAKKFDVVEDGQLTRIGFDPTYGNATYHGWLWQNNLDFFDENKLPTLNTQAHIDVLEWIMNFNSEYTRTQLTTFGEGNQLLGINPFASQRVAMIVEVDGLYQIIKDAGATFNYGVAPIPIPEGGRRVNWGSGFSIEMYDNGKGEDEQRDGSFLFYKYLLSKDVQIRLAEVNGWIMSHISAMEEYVEGNPILEKLLAEVDYAVDKVYIPYAPSWHGNDWQPYYTEALSGTKTAAEALEAARLNYLQKKQNYDAVNP
ncbi:MAG TPA: ABC transporter substrate-binding protein [Acholeplasmataceae bacterium]|nr:ABC transporter substrate-binding protein [Acholeplasmataceae bacterium]